MTWFLELSDQETRILRDSILVKADKNPILDTRVYNVKFSDGENAKLGANIVAECMYAQCDIEGNQYRLMDHIVDHRKDNNVVSKGNQKVTVNGSSYKQKTTRGWKLCIEWKDKSASWERLSDMKESYPVEVTEYAEAVGISDEPAFSWWTTHVLKNRQRIIAAVNKRYHKLTNKFGIKVPKTVEEALALDKENGNDLWWKAIQKEMRAVKVAFKILKHHQLIPSIWNVTWCSQSRWRTSLKKHA